METKVDTRHRYCQMRWKSFYMLAQVDGGLTIREWALYTGVSIHSLQTQATLWARYHYVVRRSTPDGFVYRLTRKGRAWVEDGYLLAGIRRASLVQQIYEYQERTGLLKD